MSPPDRCKWLIRWLAAWPPQCPEVGQLPHSEVPQRPMPTPWPRRDPDGDRNRHRVTLAPARRVRDRWDAVQAGTRTKSRTAPRIITPLSWGLCQPGPRRRAEQGQAVTGPHPEVVTRPPHVTARAAGTGCRPRGAAGSPERSEFPLGHCRGTGPTGARFLPGSCRSPAASRGAGAVAGSLLPPGSAP